MKVNKKCGVCGYSFTYDNTVSENPYVMPHSDGAKYYYNLWHGFVEKCPNCGYASLDLASCRKKDIVQDNIYMAVSDMPTLVALRGARPNRIADYLSAGIYYQEIGDMFNYAICMLQAGDMVYGEIMYWNEYVLDNSTSISAIQNKKLINEFKNFADGISHKGLTALEGFIKDYPEDIDAKILLAGQYLSGDKMQKMKGANILKGLHGEKLSNGQKLAIAFLQSRIK